MPTVELVPIPQMNRSAIRIALLIDVQALSILSFALIEGDLLRLLLDWPLTGPWALVAAIPNAIRIAGDHLRLCGIPQIHALSIAIDQRTLLKQSFAWINIRQLCRDSQLAALDHPLGIEETQTDSALL